MRKVLIVAIVVSLVSVGSAHTVSAGRRAKRVERTVTADYQCPCGISSARSDVGVTTWETGGKTFTTTSKDRYLMISVADTTSQIVAGQIMQDTDTSNIEFERTENFCGASEEPIEIDPGYDVFVNVYAGTCHDMETQSFPTTGTMSLTFSNVP